MKELQIELVESDSDDDEVMIVSGDSIAASENDDSDEITLDEVDYESPNRKEQKEREQIHTKEVEDRQNEKEIAEKDDTIDDEADKNQNVRNNKEIEVINDDETKKKKE